LSWCGRSAKGSRRIDTANDFIAFTDQTNDVRVHINPGAFTIRLPSKTVVSNVTGNLHEKAALDAGRVDFLVRRITALDWIR
jgi:hypothetical protein